MALKPLVSILIPAYNAESCISETIGSALAQTWSRKEILIVDDGSSDRTLEIARSFSSKMVAVIRQENQGACAARNRALRLCQGDYIQWLDSDDLLAPDKIEKQMARALNLASDRDVFSSPWRYFQCHPLDHRAFPSSIWRDLTSAEFLSIGMEENLFMTNSCWLVSRRLTECAGPWDNRLLVNQDGEYFARVLAVSNHVRFVPDAWMYYRRPGIGNVSSVSRADVKLDSQFLSLRLQISHVRAIEDTDRIRSACVKLLQRNLLYFYPERLDLVLEANELARSLGGRLDKPTMGWKYDWIRYLFGWDCANRTSVKYNFFKAKAIHNYRKTKALLSRRDPDGDTVAK